MGLPKNIEKELKDAEEDFKAVYPDRVKADEKPAITLNENTAENENEAETERNAAPADVNQFTSNENTDDPDGYKHRYDVLKGKYNSEVPKLQAQIAELRQEMQTLKERATSDEINKTPEPLSSESIDDLREEYGEDFVNSITNLVRESMGDIPNRIDAVETNTAATAFDRSCAELDRMKSGWRTTNDDPAFHAWLSETDEMSGSVRQDLLSEAFNSGDLQRVVRFFNAFEATQGQSPAVQSTPRTQPQQRRYMPDSSATGQQRDAKLFTSAEVDDFYADLTRGKYRGREKEAAAIEREIFAANREGRVIAA